VPPCRVGSSDPSCLKACWNKAPTLPPICNGLTVPPETRIAGVLDSFQQAAPNSWLTDQNGNITRYEVRLNEDEFNYVVGNRFYDRTVQASHSGQFNFPTGSNGGPLGSIELKGAWRVMTDSDDQSRYLAQDVVIIDSKLDPLTGFEDPEDGSYLTCNAAGEGPCCVRKMGLVGFHIAHKVKDNPQWVWSTFEHVDNAPIQGEVPDPSIDYSYFSASCPSGDIKCIANENPRDSHIAMTVPVQVERVIQKFPGSHPLAGQDEPLLPKPVNDNGMLWWQGRSGRTMSWSARNGRLIPEQPIRPETIREIPTRHSWRTPRWRPTRRPTRIRGWSRRASAAIA
jgi:hypothetical protein